MNTPNKPIINFDLRNPSSGQMQQLAEYQGWTTELNKTLKLINYMSLWPVGMPEIVYAVCSSERLRQNHTKLSAIKQILAKLK